MSLNTVIFRSPEENVAELDRIAQTRDRDRNYVINEAVEQYLSLHDDHRELIEEGLRQSETEEGIPMKR